MFGLFIIALCIFCSGCGNGSSTHHQTYVISKSHQASAEGKTVETITEVPSD